jgi:dTDP-4-amino-4,6-dideoxygalactose transaminase
MGGLLGQRESLAINGGRPVRADGRPWPKWPAPAPGARDNLLTVLDGDRWTLTAPITGTGLFERRFAERFAAYTGSRYCVPVDHGSSALVVALEALGLEPGDRVLAPALTWTASATAALRAGLVPVLVDVDRVTGCLAADSIDTTVGARAVIAVHWSLAMADIPAITAVAEPLGMTVLEDCAQAHGAEWAGRRAGSLGRLGCFSMQQGKVLTSGEGGAVVTDDDALAPRLQELRADSRRYRPDAGLRGESELVETATTMGANFCLSEFHAALLCAQLEVLDEQHARRAANYAVLAEMLADVPGVRLLRPAAAQTRMSLYELPVLFDEMPGGMSNAEVAAALTAELGVSFYLTDIPLHHSRLLQPWTKSTLAPLAADFLAHHRGRRFPTSDFLYDHTVVTHHSTLLGDERDMADVAAALAKVASLGVR